VEDIDKHLERQRNRDRDRERVKEIERDVLGTNEAMRVE
jgi:hypothetical protein